MQTLNNAASGIWTDDVKLAVSRASALITFSNFPVGLLTLPGDTSPLAYRLPVTHRPLAPLTAALRYEFGPTPRIDLSSGFRVLVAECVGPDDPVGRLSRSGWDMAEEMLKSSPSKVIMTRVDVDSAAELDAAIDSHEPDVLVISAHGAEVDGVAGLRVGKDFYAGSRQRPWPPVVILSACRVAPRGAGGPNIADRILEQGAVAVLATHVEVDVRHNALLCLRLFLYMALAIEGAEPEEDLLSVWHRVQGSSPIADVMNGIGPLERWMQTVGSAGVPRFVQFMTEATRGRLRRNHAFDDTERFLIELAAETGDSAILRQWLSSPGYLPESAFYSMAGLPENVLLKSRPVLSLPPLPRPRAVASGSA
ncbi:hypothetical protein [Cryobacterium psychrophilum]|nr:hypothetical protein [Cryobacterium psychrophilum]